MSATSCDDLPLLDKLEWATFPCRYISDGTTRHVVFALVIVFTILLIAYYMYMVYGDYKIAKAANVTSSHNMVASTFIPPVLSVATLLLTNWLNGKLEADRVVARQKMNDIHFWAYLNTIAPEDKDKVVKQYTEGWCHGSLAKIKQASDTQYNQYDKLMDEVELNRNRSGKARDDALVSIKRRQSSVAPSTGTASTPSPPPPAAAATTATTTAEVDPSIEDGRRRFGRLGELSGFTR